MAFLTRMKGSSNAQNTCRYHGNPPMWLLPSSRRTRLRSLHCFHWIVVHTCSNLDRGGGPSAEVDQKTRNTKIMGCARARGGGGVMRIICVAISYLRHDRSTVSRRVKGSAILDICLAVSMYNARQVWRPRGRIKGSSQRRRLRFAKTLPHTSTVPPPPSLCRPRGTRTGRQTPARVFPWRRPFTTAAPNNKTPSHHANSTDCHPRRQNQTASHLRPTPVDPAKLPPPSGARKGEQAARPPCKRGSLISVLAPYTEGLRPHALIPPPRRWAIQLAAESSSWVWVGREEKHAQG